MGFAPNYAFLMFSRFVAGVGVGYAGMIAPVYITEISPPSCRGFLVSLPDISINVGILLGCVSNLGFSKLPLHLGWRFMLGIGAIPSVFIAVGVLAMPESPRWLVMQGRVAEAKRVLHKTSDSVEEAKLRLSDIKQAAGVPEDCDDDEDVNVQVSRAKKSTTTHGGVWKELLIRPTPTVRRILLAGVAIHFFQQSSGIDAVVLYSPEVFEKAGITEDTQKLLATMAVGFFKTVIILIPIFFLDRVGRRPLLLSSLGGMVVSLFTLGTTLTVVNDRHYSTNSHPLPWAVGLSIVSLVGFVTFFSVGMGPVTGVYSSEILPLRLRAQGMSVLVAVNRVVSGVVSMTFLSLSKAITTGGAFFLFSGIAAVGWLFFFTFLPETRGRTLESMGELFGEFKWKLDLVNKDGEELTSYNVENCKNDDTVR